MDENGREGAGMPGGLAGWLLARWHGGAARRQPRLRLVEKIALGPRQALSLVEAEGRKLLVATSAEGAPAFYALGPGREAGREPGRRIDARGGTGSRKRVTW